MSARYRKQNAENGQSGRHSTTQNLEGCYEAPIDRFLPIADLADFHCRRLQLATIGKERVPQLKCGMPIKSPVFPGPRTARGAVLAVLLLNEEQAGAEPLHGRVTLAAIIRTLKRKYHWPIETTSFPSNATDARATWATVYSLSPEVIAAAMDRGGRDWLKVSLMGGANR